MDSGQISSYSSTKISSLNPCFHMFSSILKMLQRIVQLNTVLGIIEIKKKHLLWSILVSLSNTAYIHPLPCDCCQSVGLCLLISWNWLLQPHPVFLLWVSKNPYCSFNWLWCSSSLSVLNHWEMLGILEDKRSYVNASCCWVNWSQVFLQMYLLYAVIRKHEYFVFRSLTPTLKHELLWALECHPSGHEGAGVVVGTGGGVTPSTNCLQRNIDFSSQFTTSHNPAVVPVLMATQPGSLPSWHTKENKTN